MTGEKKASDLNSKETVADCPAKGQDNQDCAALESQDGSGPWSFHVRSWRRLIIIVLVKHGSGYSRFPSSSCAGPSPICFHARAAQSMKPGAASLRAPYERCARKEKVSMMIGRKASGCVDNRRGVRTRSGKENC